MVGARVARPSPPSSMLSLAQEAALCKTGRLFIPSLLHSARDMCPTLKVGGRGAAQGGQRVRWAFIFPGPVALAAVKGGLEKGPDEVPDGMWRANA